MNEHGTLTPAEMRANYMRGVINGAVFTLGEAVSNPGLVLSLLVRQLGGSLTLVSLIPVIQSTGYLLPQLLVGGYVQSLPYKLPIYRTFAALRIVAQLAVVCACFFASEIAPSYALAAILVCYALFNFGGGVTTLSFQDIVAKIVPPTQRGRFFGTRQLYGGLLAFAIAGPFVRWMLSDESPLAFPHNFALISLVSLVCYATGMLFFARVREPAAQLLVPRQGIGAALRAAPAILRGNERYRTFIIVRLCLLIGRLAEPFAIIYVTEQLHLGKSIAGLLIAVSAVAAASSNVVWGRLGDSRGMVWLLRFTGTLAIFPPLMLFAAPWIAPFGVYVLIGWLLIASLIGGISVDGVGIASMTFLLEVSPPEQRPLYMGLANTLLGIGAVIPVAGGILVSTAGYPVTFIIAALWSVLAIGISGSLRPPPHPTVVP
jgi:MFS family permease